MRHASNKKVLGVVGAVLVAALALIVAVIPAGALTVTFVRHGESQANADGIIDTKVPGPGLTQTGREQADKVATVLIETPHDGVFASTMIRTQQTARPYAALFKNKPTGQVTVSDDPDNPDFGKDIVVLNGLQEINAGIFEGSSEDSGLGRLGYALAPVAWTLGLRFVRIPGSEDGNEFDARMDAALEQIADPTQGDSENPVVFSHGATIMFWTMMNVANPDLTLLLSHQLDNTETVVVEKNDDGSWTLKSWAGQEVGPANLPTQLFVNTRDLIVAPQTALYNFSRDASAETGVAAVRDVADATVKFATETVKDLGNGARSLAPAQQNNTSVSKLAAMRAEKDSAATDLTGGNKVRPGSRIASTLESNIQQTNEGVDGAVRDVRNEVSRSLKKAGEAVKKVADAARDAAKAPRDRAEKDAA
ncbi:histidine phosphatase [Mycolicibacterium agri]|uniref:Histidine phosphatase n=1 Tax=Mycolicibacterium agri TaxID=36811 RepID=A0A2A7NGS6_MYCAG|nr:histidine phosphatase family protein [Mycolicibacterium agri]PEG43144.1 histidine phosphatase [Mycolicibacterium agri]GFG54461.1 hypothetical protein MAGR_59020 [Mycolicibacterium agri]